MTTDVQEIVVDASWPEGFYTYDVYYSADGEVWEVMPAEKFSKPEWDTVPVLIITATQDWTWDPVKKGDCVQRTSEPPRVLRRLV